MTIISTTTKTRLNSGYKAQAVELANTRYYNFTFILCASLFVTGFFISKPVHSSEPDAILENVYMYRYKTESGEKIVGFQVPSESIKFGYEMLNKRLRVIRTIEPAPSDEELEALEEKKLSKKEEQRLLQTFSNSADAERARDRKIGALDVIIKITTGNIHRLNLEYETLASQAAHIEKRGGAIPSEHQSNMDSITRQISDANKFINEKNVEIDQLYKDYGGDIKRLKAIEARSKSQPKGQAAAN